MFYENSYNVKSTTLKKSIKSFSNSLNADVDSGVMDISESPMVYNFDYSDGVLKDGLGIRKLSLRYSAISPNSYKVIDMPSDMSFIIGCWLFTAWAPDQNINRPFLIMYSNTGDFYYNRIHASSGEIVKINGLNFTEKPIVSSCKIDGVDTLILVSEKDGMYTWQFPGVIKQIENVPSISSLCVHDDRLFITTHGEKKTVMYSESLDPTNFNVSTGGSVIEMADGFGACNKVLSFNGYLYVFRDFNIAKLTTYANNDDYSVSQLYVSNGRIYDKTVAICGNKIVYLASDGIYEFDGTKAKKMNLKINNLFKNVDNINAVAGYSNGCYYVACRINYNDDILVGDESPYEGVNLNNVLLKIDINSYSVSLLRGYDICDVSIINDIYKSEVAVIVRETTGHYKVGLIDESGMYFDVPNEKLWKGAFFDFGTPNKNKVITEICLESKRDIVIEIVSDLESRSIDVIGMSGCQVVNPYVRGKKFSIAFKSNVSGNYIANFQVVVGYV